MSEARGPHGELAIRTFAMPRDTNAYGDIFGGWLVSQMDLAAAIIARQTSQARIATVAIDKLSFMRPVNVGDIICCYAELIKVGKTSMTIRVEAWSISAGSVTRRQASEGTFTFVALDDKGQPQSVYPS